MVLYDLKFVSVAFFLLVFFYKGGWITSVWAFNQAACSKTDVLCCARAERMSSLFTVEPGANFFWNTNSCLTAPPASLDTPAPPTPRPVSVCVCIGRLQKTYQAPGDYHPLNSKHHQLHPSALPKSNLRNKIDLPPPSPPLPMASACSPVLGCLLKQPVPPTSAKRDWVRSCWGGTCMCAHTYLLTYPTAIAQTSACVVTCEHSNFAMWAQRLTGHWLIKIIAHLLPFLLKLSPLHFTCRR